MAAKRKSTAEQKAMHKRAYKKIILDLVTKKHANYCNVIECNTYIEAIAKLRKIEMTVNPAALRVAVHLSYWSSMGKVSSSFRFLLLLHYRLHRLLNQQK